MSKIALIGPLKEWGGLERLFVALASEYAAGGHSVEIVRVRGGQTPYPDELPRGVEVTTLPTAGKAHAIPRIAGWMNASRPDAVVTVKDHTAKACVLARAIARHRPRLVVVVSNTLSYVARRPIQRFSIPLLYARADRVVALSEGVAADLRTNFSIPGERIDVIYQPVIPMDLKQRLAKEVDHPWMSKSQEVPVLLGCGRLTYQKNFHLLISALAQLRQHRPARLVILGEGVDRESLAGHARALGVADHVDLFGAVPDPLPYMGAADVFVLSSRYEGFANVVAEALSTGVRVVSTDCPSGPREILRDGKFGWLVEPGDAAGLARAVDSALNTPRLSVPAEAIDAFRTETVAHQYLRSMGITVGDGEAAYARIPPQQGDAS